MFFQIILYTPQNNLSIPKILDYVSGKTFQVLGNTVL